MNIAKKIFFVIPDLGGGGAQRIISILINNLDRDLYQPTLVLIKRDGERDFLKDLKEDVEIVNLGIRLSLKYSALLFCFRLIKLLIKKRPDILFMGAGTQNSFFSPFLFLIPRSIKKIARESNLPSLFERYKIVKYFYKKFYAKYDIIIAQSEDMFNELVSNFQIDKNKIIKINNPVDVNYIKSKLKKNSSKLFNNSKLNFVAAGRLNYQKGFDLLLPEFKKLFQIDNRVNLKILGEGKEKMALENQVVKLGLSKNVQFIGNVNNPYIYMKNADYFVLSSRFEGFPNVLLESLVCGCPILSNNCPGGINEIINEKNGVIFSFNDGDFVEKALMLINTKFNTKHISEEAVEKYNITKKIMEYYKVFN